ncbi:MAG: dTDP-4-dehydrorhamnose 3,5-epimerase family protein [Candidatus Omnitrophica bacterium]|nr:dTDP-4-dehydrorhamnose 3,5-epimerase family protein [Candidatus Omnitrophota bacterium]
MTQTGKSKFIAGVEVKQLKVLCDERGRLMEVLRSDEKIFEKFGQSYMTACYPGVVKGWHFHKKQVDHFVCVHGMIKLVLYDRRSDAPTYGEVNEFFLGTHNPILVKVPAYVLHGFKCISTEEAIIINYPTEVYHYDQPDEFRVEPHSVEIPYDWARKDR